ncbi:MAG: aspartate aminotransferase family protein [Pelagibacteraceae bacterium]|nr:aspartate aminotransferase family protein [Pelagibacteraceae bacterium]
MKKNSTSYIMPTYGDRDLTFERGRGCYLFTPSGEKYLDFAGGIAVNSLGHCHPKLVSVLKKQSEKLWHTSNLYKNKNQELYAKELCENTFANRVFFTNSGAEAIECGLKVIKSYWNLKNKNKKYIITFKGAFHGRTFAALSAQKNKKYSDGFTPLLSGFKNIPFNDEESLIKNINKETAAILIEPIQGEGGIKPAQLKFLKFVRNICDKNNILLFLDEVQSGFGRSGKLYSYEWAKIKPDILATAKGIGSGFPLGACLATKEASIGMTQGIHGSTYGGNPLGISVGREVLKIISDKNFLTKVDFISRYLWKNLKKIQSSYNSIVEIRGAGLLLGIKIKQNNVMVSNILKKNRLLTVPAGDNVIRLAPPLIINKKHADEALTIINKTFKNLK